MNKKGEIGLFLIIIIILISFVIALKYNLDNEMLEAENACKAFNPHFQILSTVVYHKYQTYDYQCCYLKEEAINKTLVRKNDYFCQKIIDKNRT